MKVSIIIPAYNVGKYLESCVQSLLSQTHNDIEVVLIDDGSTDDTAQKSDELALSDMRVVVCHKKNRGVSSARNVGIRHATGDYIMFVDGDDWLDRTCVADMLDNIRENNSDACSCNSYYKNNTLQIATNLTPNKALSSEYVVREHLHYRFIASPCLTMWQRTCVENILFNESIHTLEDWEYNFRCLTKICHISILNKAYYHYRTVEGSASVSPLNNRKLTCLNIPKYVNNYINANHLDLVVEAEYLPVFLTYHLLVIYATQGAVDSSEIKLREFARGTLCHVLFNKTVDIKHKMYLMIASVHPSLFRILFKIKYKK